MDSNELPDNPSEEIYQQFKTRGLALFDQYEARVKELVHDLLEHRPHCIPYQRERSELCPGGLLVESVEAMDQEELQRALIAAVIVIARRE